ncbi:hypothetical protein FZEAL_3488 [Fusarium zealandicum]|uniref:Uncharacterized protein n=1 Tax=Fusarium zealandicum TaxID=1053134 RepID=A0A8H4UPI8_9HYPO|nr:hypothetical protein FZEAL_3488 [Fusarium zealandicum]
MDNESSNPPGQAKTPSGTLPGKLAQAFLAPSPGNSLEADSRFQSPLVDPTSPNSSVFRTEHESLRGLLGTKLDNNNNNKEGQQGGAGLGIFNTASGEQIRQSESLLKRLSNSKWAIVICFLVGTGAALGHHFLYHHLDGREARDQQWWLRLGQLISFIAKAGFVIAVLMAQQQAAWRAVGRNCFSVEAVDSLFGATHNPMELLNKESWKKAWVVMFLAIYVWISPLVVIFSSATLDVVLAGRRQNTTCPSVRTLNFAHEEINDWREPGVAENQTFIGLSLSSWNNTNTDKEDPNFFDYWTGGSAQFEAIALKVLFGKQAIQRENVSVEVCGADWNCWTTVNFIAPGYKCEEMAKGKDAAIKNLGQATAPFNMSELAPLGNFTYYAVTDQGEYAEQQIDVLTGGIPTMAPPYPQNLGAFRTEPIIWLGYASVEDVTKEPPKNESATGWNGKGWDDFYTPIIFACEHYETNYTVRLNYTGEMQTYEVLDRDYMHRIIDTDIQAQESDDGTLDKTAALPEDNYVFPQDVKRYRRIGAYHSMGKQLRDLINGKIELPNFITASKVIQSRLLDRHHLLAVPNLKEAVRDLYEDMIISLFSDPQMLAVSWAADPSKFTGVAVGGPETNYPCERERIAPFFIYQWRVLVAVYTVSFVVAMVGVAWGILAMHKDGVREQREMTFSSIAAATKEVSLDKCMDKGTKIRSYPVGGRPGDRVYEFRLEGQDNGQREKMGPLINEV